MLLASPRLVAKVHHEINCSVGVCKISRVEALARRTRCELRIQLSLERIVDRHVGHHGNDDTLNLTIENREIIGRDFWRKQVHNISFERLESLLLASNEIKSSLVEESSFRKGHVLDHFHELSVDGLNHIRSCDGNRRTNRNASCIIQPIQGHTCPSWKENCQIVSISRYVWTILLSSNEMSRENDR